LTGQIFYTECPSCYSPHITKSLTATDHTVSNESFEIWHCNSCTLRFTQNVPSQDSIGRYYQSENYISHTDTNKGIVNRLYRLVRRLTLKSKRNTVSSFTRLKKGTLLDVGAGTGAFASFMQQSGWSVSAIEPDSQARKKAADLYSIQLDDSSMLFEFGENRFDAITLWHVIEHVHSLHEYLDQLKKTLKPGGAIFIAVPNYTCYDAGLYKEFWAAYDTPRHLYHFSPASMRKLLESHGLQLQNIQPMWLDSFYVSLLSEKYRSGHENLVKGFWNGAVSNFQALFNKEKASSLIYIISKE
jgi:2-polyprenyl-3-methyl-5-hydroxy-6-metoxy-1,4-benzoquinol methylase